MNVFVFSNRVLVHSTRCNECLPKSFYNRLCSGFWYVIRNKGYWIIGSLEVFNELNNKDNYLFPTLYAFLLFLGAIAKPAKFPVHVWLPDEMEGSTPISVLIHAATMVAAGIFLVTRLLPLFLGIPYIMNKISIIGVVTLQLGATLALSQRSLAYSTMSQLGYIMSALGVGSYRAAWFHLITHAYSKSIIVFGFGIYYSFHGTSRWLFAW